MLGAHAKLQLLLADMHVLPHAKFGFRDEDALSAGLNRLPFRENVLIGYSPKSHAHRLVNRVIVGPGKFWENVDIFVRIFVGEIFIQPIANRCLRTFEDATFNFVIPAHLKLNSLAF